MHFFNITKHAQRIQPAINNALNKLASTVKLLLITELNTTQIQCIASSTQQLIQL